MGVIYTIAPYLLPRLVPQMHALAPHMPLYLRENFTHVLAEQLRQGELDVIVVAHPFSEPGIVTQRSADEPFCLALPAGHPLEALSIIDPKEIAGENLLLLGSGNCFRDQVVQACPRLSEPGGADGSLEGAPWRRFNTWSVAVRASRSFRFGRRIVAAERVTTALPAVQRACSFETGCDRMARQFSTITRYRHSAASYTRFAAIRRHASKVIDARSSRAPQGFT